MNDEKPTYRLEDLEAALKQVIGEPPGGLNILKDIHIVRRSLLQHEERRLSRKLGKDHPRVRRLEACLEHNLNLVKDLEVELEIARIRVPEVEANDALIHGRVVDENLRGLTDLAVNLEDEKGKNIRFLGEAETDASGYYALRVDPAKIAKMPKVAGKAGYLTIRSRTGKVVHREPAPLEIAEGDRVFVEVALRREDLRPVRRGTKRVDREDEAGNEDKQG